MAEFYRFPQWVVTALVMVTAVCIALQTLIVSFSFRRLPAGWGRRAENGMECAVLAALFLFAALLGQVQYGLYGGFLLPSAYGNTRQVVFLLCAVLATAAAVGTELIWPFFVIGGAAVLLPLTEVVTGTAYPFFFLAALLYFLVRSVHICLLRRRELYTQISSISIKEAIDTLHTGLLFFRQSGEPLLCNRRMDALARQLTGQPLRSGLEFQRHLESGELQCGCVREVLGDQQVFRLSDASVWSITAHAIPMGRRVCVLLTADDVTARWDAVKHLARQNEALEQRGRELRHTIEHLQAICEAEEIARSKGRVHDLLGQRISLLLRALRDGQQPDEALLMDFARSLPTALREDSTPSQQSVCPYCGGVIQSDFYDWQTEAFAVYEQMGANQEKALWLLFWGGILYACLFLSLWLIQNTLISLAAGMGAAVLVLAAVIAVSTITYGKQEKLEQEIVRYSENYLRSCISEALYPEGNRTDRMDYSVGTIRLKKVVNTEETTTITVQVYISETHLPQGRKPHTRKYKRTLVLQRARYPQRRKQDGKLFTERECPSCGANFVPDENHCCSFCGYSFQADSAKWVVQTGQV